MKIRARLGTTTKNVVIGDDVASFVQISEMRMLIQNAFGNLLDQPFKMGLNKSEPFTDEDATIEECGIVHCDLIHVITENPIPVVTAKKFKVQEKREECTKDISMSGCSKEESSHRPYEPMALSCISAYMDKVLYCSDAVDNRVPEQLEMLLRSSSAETCQEIVIVALHQLLLESGFQFETNVKDADSSIPKELPTNLKEIFTNQRTQSFYRLLYNHPDYEGMTAVLTCIPMDKMLVIQGKLHSLPFPAENYPELIINCEEFIAQMRTDSAAATYKNLRLLSANFKDRVVFRFFIELKIALGIPDDTGFLGLVSEIQLKILSYLDFRSLMKVSLVCKDLYEKSRDSCLWKRLSARKMKFQKIA